MIEEEEQVEDWMKGFRCSWLVRENGLGAPEFYVKYSVPLGFYIEAHYYVCLLFLCLQV